MEEIKGLEEYKNITDSEVFAKLKEMKAHGNITVYNHSIEVAKLCLKIKDALNIDIDNKKLIEAALLHDLYLYDWHKTPKGIGLHGFAHPKIAAENAKTHFNIGSDVYKSIMSHMWPLTFFRIPRTKEALILCVADKICAFKETFHIK